MLAYSSLRSTSGISLQSRSRSIPPQTPVIAPASTITTGLPFTAAATSQPMIENAASPSASTAVNSDFSRATCVAVIDANVAAASVSSRYSGCATQVSG